MSYSCSDFTDDVLNSLVECGFLKEDDVPSDDPEGQIQCFYAAMGKLIKPLNQLIDTVEATGGVVQAPNGYYEPEGEHTWIDLGEAYVSACAAIGRKPLIVKDGEDEESDHA